MSSRAQSKYKGGKKGFLSTKKVINHAKSLSTRALKGIFRAGPARWGTGRGAGRRAPGAGFERGAGLTALPPGGAAARVSPSQGPRRHRGAPCGRRRCSVGFLSTSVPTSEASLPWRWRRDARPTWPGAAPGRGGGRPSQACAPASPASDAPQNGAPGRARAHPAASPVVTEGKLKRVPKSSLLMSSRVFAVETLCPHV